MQRINTNHSTTSRTIPEAPIQSPISPEFNIVSKESLRFNMTGARSPASKTGMAKINWNQRHTQSKYNDVHCHMPQYDGTELRTAEAVKASEEIGIDHSTRTPIPTTLVSTKNNKDRFQLYKMSPHCSEHFYVPMKLESV